MKCFPYLLLLAWPLLAAPKPISPASDPLMKRAKKVCGNVEWEAVRLRKVPMGVITFCAACVKGCGWNKTNFTDTAEWIDADDLQIGPVYFISDLKSEPFDIDEESPFRMSHVSGALGMATHSSYRITPEGKVEQQLFATRLGGKKDFEKIPLLRMAVDCAKGKCTYAKPQCVLTRADAELPEERTAALGLKSWKDYPKDTLYFIDRIALMAAAGDRQMYWALASHFPQLPEEDKSLTSLFHNAVYGNRLKTEALFEFGCGKDGYEPLTPGELETAKRTQSVLSEVKEQDRFIGAKVEGIPDNHTFIKYGLKEGDVVVGFENMVMSLYVLRDLPSRLGSDDVKLNILRGGKPQTLVVPHTQSPTPFRPVDDHLAENLPVFLRKG